MLNASTNFEGKDISQDILKTQLYLNKDYFWGKSLNDLNGACEKCFNDNWWKSKNVSDLVNHEIMHSKINYGNSIEKAEALYERLL